MKRNTELTAIGSRRSSSEREGLGFEVGLAKGRLGGNLREEHVDPFLAPDEERHAESADLLDDDQPSSLEAADEDSSQSPDDTLGLYLRQMGAIPLLNRKQELELAQRLETVRQRYRHAALSSWYVLGRVLETFDRIKAGKQALDPTIDVVTSLGLSRERILSRIPGHLRTL